MFGSLNHSREEERTNLERLTIAELGTVQRFYSSILQLSADECEVKVENLPETETSLQMAQASEDSNKNGSSSSRLLQALGSRDDHSRHSPPPMLLRVDDNNNKFPSARSSSNYNYGTNLYRPLQELNLHEMNVNLGTWTSPLHLFHFRPNSLSAFNDQSSSGNMNYKQYLNAYHMHVGLNRQKQYGYFCRYAYYDHYSQVKQLYEVNECCTVIALPNGSTVQDKYVQATAPAVSSYRANKQSDVANPITDSLKGFLYGSYEQPPVTHTPRTDYEWALDDDKFLSMESQVTQICGFKKLYYFIKDKIIVRQRQQEINEELVLLRYEINKRRYVVSKISDEIKKNNETLKYYGDQQLKLSRFSGPYMDEILEQNLQLYTSAQEVSEKNMELVKMLSLIRKNIAAYERQVCIYNKELYQIDIILQH